jgi:cell division protein FtsL
VAGGVVWIVCVAALLAGVVALNVAVLRLNMGVDKYDRQKAQLRFDNQALASELSSAAAAARIEARARAAGLVPAPDAPTTVHLRP